MSESHHDVVAGPSNRFRPSDVLRLCIIGLTWGTAYQVSLSFPDLAGVIGMVWPASGIALAAMLVSPARLRPAILTVIGVTSITCGLVRGSPISSIIGFAIGNVAEPALCTWLMIRMCGPRITFSRVVEVLALLVVAVFGDSLISLIGASTAAYVFGQPFLVVYRTMCIANCLGTLLVTPLIVTWIIPMRHSRTRHWQWYAELAIVVATAQFLSWAYFGASRESFTVRPHSYMLLIPLVWAGLRLGPRGAATTVTALALVEIGTTIAGAGLFPLGGNTPEERTFYVQLFIASKCAIALLLAASISERRQAMQRLTDSETQLRALADNLPDSMFYQLVRDIDGTMRFRYVSAGVERLHGLRADEVLSDPALLYNQILEEDRAKVSAGEEASSRDMSVFNTFVRMRRQDGEMQWVHICSKPRLLPDGRILWDGIETDITASKTTEAELQKYRDSLEHLVYERTKELEAAQEKLVQGERLAALGQITATVSHELRNPLGTIRGSLYLLRQVLDTSDPRTAKPLERADRNVERCNRIIEDLLDFTRQSRLLIEHVDVDDWLGSVLDDLLPPAGIELRRALNGRTMAGIDTEKLRRCVCNLLSNAYDSVLAREDGQKVVEVATRSADGTLTVSITDSGSGIVSEDIERIWEPLFTTKGFGVGLGLPHVKQLVELHKGTISCANREGGGAEFTIKLPLNN
jgi:PAS domain S-box-containing protein